MYHITPVAKCMAVGIQYVVMATEGCGYMTGALWYALYIRKY